MALLKITCKELVISYGEQIALDINALDISGNTFALVGHNGAGKSTFIKALLKVLEPAHGSLDLTLLSESGATKALDPHADIAFCPESGSAFSDVSVESYLQFWCRIKHSSGDYFRKGDGKRYCEVLGLESLYKKLGRELSKGQRRRVQTAIGFLCKPKVFLLDEPFDGLDVQRTGELAKLIEQHRESIGFIISSHRMDIVERLADQVIVLKHGSVQAAGAIAQVCKELVPSATAQPTLVEAISHYLTGFGEEA